VKGPLDKTGLESTLKWANIFLTTNKATKITLTGICRITWNAIMAVIFQRLWESSGNMTKPTIFDFRNQYQSSQHKKNVVLRFLLIFMHN